MTDSFAASPPQPARSQARLFCCASTACLSSNSEAVRKEFERLLSQGVGVEVRQSGCMGLCSRGPMVRIERPDGSDALYESVTAELAPRIAEMLTGDAPAPEQLLDQQVPFFARQVRIVTAHAGRIDPEAIEDYLAVGGYAALNTAVTSMRPQDVVAEITQSGLRGRGGRGLPHWCEVGARCASSSRPEIRHLQRR